MTYNKEVMTEQCVIGIFYFHIYCKRSGLEDLGIRALKAVMKIKAALGPLFRKNIKKFYSSL